MKNRFVVHLHLAKRAGRHFDIRFVIPNSKLWASFATKKEIPMETGKKIMVFRTHDHSEKEALTVGTIKDGYGAGELILWDEGSTKIEKYTNPHMILIFNGKKLKGKYHFINLNQITRKSNKERGYLFFKAKVNPSSDEIKKIKINKTEFKNFHEKINKLIDLF